MDPPTDRPSSVSLGLGVVLGLVEKATLTSWSVSLSQNHRTKNKVNGMISALSLSALVPNRILFDGKATEEGGRRSVRDEGKDERWRWRLARGESERRNMACSLWVGLSFPSKSILPYLEQEQILVKRERRRSGDSRETAEIIPLTILVLLTDLVPPSSVESLESHES
jgi:hypothetical protein